MLKRLGKDSLIYGVSDFTTSFVSFFTFPLVATALTPTSFGALELIVSIMSILGLLMNCGQNNSVARFYWDKDTRPEERPSIVTLGFVIQGFLGLIIVFLSLFFVFLSNYFYTIIKIPFSETALFLGITLIFFGQWNRFILDVLRLHFSSIKFVLISIVSKVGSAFSGLFVVVILGYGVEGLLGVQALILLIVLPYALYLVRKDITTKIEFKWFRKLMQYGYPFIFAGLAYNLLATTDRWMLLKFTTIEEVGVYSVSYKFSIIVLMVSSAFGMAWSPMAMKIRTDLPDSYRKLFSYILLLLFYVMLAIGGGVALFSGEIVHIFMGDMYKDSALPLAILCFGIVFKATEQITLVGISIENKTYLFARLTWIVTILNFILNWLFIPFWGATGAAVATTLSYCFLTICFMFFSQRLHPLPVPWGRITYLLFIFVFIVFCSIYLQSSIIDTSLIMLKLLISLCCLYLGYLILPIQELKKFKDYSLGI